MSTHTRNSAAASGSDTKLSKDQKLMTIETENIRLQTALDAKSSSPKLLLEGLDADARMLNSGGGYGAPDADARMIGGSDGYGAVWEADSSRADSQQGMPDSTTFGLLSQWQRYIKNNPTKAKTVFVPGENDSLRVLNPGSHPPDWYWNHPRPRVFAIAYPIAYLYFSPYYL